MILNMIVPTRTQIPSYEQLVMDWNLKDIVRGAISVLHTEGYCHVDLRKYKCDNFIKMFKDSFSEERLSQFFIISNDQGSKNIFIIDCSQIKMISKKFEEQIVPGRSEFVNIYFPSNLKCPIKIFDHEISEFEKFLKNLGRYDLLLNLK